MKDRCEKLYKYDKICMHQNVAPDTLPGSARIVPVMDCWLNDRYMSNTLISTKNFINYHYHTGFSPHWLGVVASDYPEENPDHRVGTLYKW